MSDVHDLGGRLDFGPVPGTRDELSFHAAWEARVFGIMRALIGRGTFNFDEFRFAVERIELYDRFVNRTVEVATPDLRLRPPRGGGNRVDPRRLDGGVGKRVGTVDVHGAGHSGAGG